MREAGEGEDRRALDEEARWMVRRRLVMLLAFRDILEVASARNAFHCGGMGDRNMLRPRVHV